jgi:hypothetical protein
MKKFIVPLIVVWGISFLLYFLLHDETMNTVIANQVSNSSLSTKGLNVINTFWTIFWFIPSIFTIIYFFIIYKIKKGINVK